VAPAERPFLGGMFFLWRAHLNGNSNFALSSVLFFAGLFLPLKLGRVLPWVKVGPPLTCCASPEMEF